MILTRPQITQLGKHIWELKASIQLPAARDDVFAFFKDAGNLETLTPNSVRFKILTPMPVDMKKGARIAYRMKILGVPILWRTVITLWDPPFRFADYQESGPYRLWHHTHTFEAVDRHRTLVSDRVVYRPPAEWITHPLFVRRELTRIFEYRQEALQAVFQKAQATAVGVS